MYTLTLSPLFSLIESLSSVIGRVIFPWIDTELVMDPIPNPFLVPFPNPFLVPVPNLLLDHDSVHVSGRSTGVLNGMVVKKRVMMNRNHNRRVGARWSIDAGRRISGAEFEDNTRSSDVTDGSSDTQDLENLRGSESSDYSSDFSPENSDISSDFSEATPGQDRWLDGVMIQAAKWGGERVMHQVLDGVVDEVCNRVMVKEVGLGKGGWVVVEYI
ncbi:hypothetical protein FPQ18DRAFT_417223 [Pyronema domesticum]|nr:hypothetical protein FPQ18DRAFT_417223 [Pyronema domesticum]